MKIILEQDEIFDALKEAVTKKINNVTLADENSCSFRVIDHQQDIEVEDYTVEFIVNVEAIKKNPIPDGPIPR